MESPILKHLLEDFKLVEDSKSTVHIRHSVSLRVLLLEKKEVLYITDGSIIVQAIMILVNENSTREDFPKPFNRIRNQYYNFNTRSANLFNFNEADCDHIVPELMCAYNPYRP
jgi:hypothetical protein